ncbi:MAG: potassium-transporting ATPase subunit F [Chlamydiales bacterium]|nr:potassium-transporting ATPase subunit F [Chlamydiales bacterium]
MLYLILGIVTFCVLVYLFITIIWPEKF